MLSLRYGIDWAIAAQIPGAELGDGRFLLFGYGPLVATLSTKVPGRDSNRICEPFGLSSGHTLQVTASPERIDLVSTQSPTALVGCRGRTPFSAREIGCELGAGAGGFLGLDRGVPADLA